jgi:choline dehydrogenase
VVKEEFRVAEVSRRVFLKLAAATGITLSLGGCSLLAPSRPEPQGCVEAGPVQAGGSEYDYIIVGSGAGGGPLAANLANAGYRVLLLEAGGKEETPNYSVPAFHPLSTVDQYLQWNYYVRHYADDPRHNNDSKRDKERKVIWYPRAGTLGGCTAHNAMITIYPHESDWDRIATLTDDASWSSDRMRRYFQLI